MENSHRFFENRDCKYFPCHAPGGQEAFNCLFCFCPMYAYADCPGAPSFLKKKDGRMIKDCTGCTFPHDPANYDVVIGFLREGGHKLTNS